MSRADSLQIFVRRFVVALVVATVISGSAAFVANVVETQKFNDITTVMIPNNVLSPPGKPGAPANYLIIGSDSRAFVDTPEQAKAFGSAKDVGGARSDVMMVVHVEPELGTALVVSFPRDTEVAIEGHGRDRLNAAFAYGGPALTIQTFQKNFAVPIQHFLSVNFDGFRKIVDAIGHVKIYFPTPARDVFTGLYQPVAGCVSLNGADALAYARSRHYLIPRDGVSNPDPNNTDDWIEDPRSDLDRIQRQQYFLRSLGQTALNRSAGNPATALHLADAVVSSMTKDQNLTNKELKALVRTFRGLDPATVQMTTLPVTGGIRSPLVTQYPEATPVLDRLKDLHRPPTGLPNAVPPASVKVVVVDGSGVTGRAADVQSALVGRGFRSGGSADAGDSYPKTQVRYAPGQASKGLTAALYLGTANVVEAASTSVQDGSRILRGDVLVVVGRDYPSLRGLLTQSASSTSSTTITSAITSASSRPATSTSTTTTTPATTPDTRYVPVSPKSLEPLVGCP